MSLSVLVDPLLKLVALIVVGLVGLAITRISAYAKTRTLQSTLHEAANNAAGRVLVKLAQGTMELDHVHVSDSQLADITAEALATIPGVMAQLGLTPENVAQMVVGAVGKALASDPTVPTLASPALAPPAPVAPAPVAPAMVARSYLAGPRTASESFVPQSTVRP